MEHFSRWSRAALDFVTQLYRRSGPSYRIQTACVHPVVSLAEQDKNNLGQPGGFQAQVSRDRLQRDLRGFPNRVAVCTRADRRKSDGLDRVLFGKREARPVAGSQQLRLAMPAIAIHGPDGMEHEF